MIVYKGLGHYGRFCNGCFQIASTIGIAVKSGQPWGFPEWKNYDHAERFGSTEDIELEKYFVNPLRRMHEFNYQDYFVHWGYHDHMFPSGNWNLSGHMQSEKYFSHCMPLIRDVFRMKDEPQQNDLCAIHIRLGDYDDNYHPRLTKEYYAQAMHQFPDSTFLVFSDDLDSARQIFGDDVLYSQEKDYIQDFKMMKMCRDFIIGNSSYSLFASILADHPDKKIVCPSRWFGTCAGLETYDLYPKNAMVI